jgi:hypothetical protein
MAFLAPPETAAFTHAEARTGFEVVTFRPVDGGWHIDGCTSAVEAGDAWSVDYHIEVDEGWVTRSALVANLSAAGRRSVALHADGAGRWLIDGLPAPHLDGCLDLDLESSAVTNALPVRRLALAVGADADAPAAYVRAADLFVERLEQRYVRVCDDGERRCYDYTAPAFDFACRLRYDGAGVVLTYPGIAVRAA